VELDVSGQNARFNASPASSDAGSRATSRDRAAEFVERENRSEPKDTPRERRGSGRTQYRRGGGQVARVNSLVLMAPLVLSVLIGGTKVEALLDSGANVSLIDADLATRMNLLVSPTNCDAPRDFSSNRVDVQGVTKLQVNSGGGENKILASNVNAIVSRGCPHEVVLGTDFFEKLGKATINMESGMLETTAEDGEEVHLPFEGRVTSSRVNCAVTMMKATTIPARQSCMINCMVHIPDTDDMLYKDYMFLGGEALDKKQEDIEVADAVVMPAKRIIPVCVTNHGMKPVRLAEDQTMGRIVPVSDKEAPYAYRPDQEKLRLRDGILQRQEEIRRVAHVGKGRPQPEKASSRRRTCLRSSRT
jgi:hypothetical protein